MTEMFGEAWSPMSVPDLAPDDDEAKNIILRATDLFNKKRYVTVTKNGKGWLKPRI